MTWDSLQQFVRIALYSAGGWVFGSAVADGALFQSALGGAMAIGAFLWWLIWERNRPKA